MKQEASTTCKAPMDGVQCKFEYLEHTADVYIVAYGSDILELFSNAGLALFETMTDISRINEKVKKVIKALGFDLESLLYKWLEELLILYYSENIMCREVVAEKIEVRRVTDGVEYELLGFCSGEEFDLSRHIPRIEVKAVTYHLMKILLSESTWKAYFVLDI
ncbi:MAG: archease [Sulfolobales archaeon]|nr:archease [Sulfolobales archaeon]MCX8199631.1 archease [Sulfolobales archaeon]MDW8170585.1 archease [Desulfurococcaceae archaeon]